MDAFGDREKSSYPNAQAPGNGVQFDIVQQAEKRLKKFKTAIEIPDEAKLLRANTMMLELYAALLDNRLSKTDNNT